jgi:hypothetical protein
VNSDTVKLLVAVLGFVGGIIALITAIIGRKKEVVNRQEFVYRHHGLPAAGGQAASELLCPHCRGSQFTRALGVKGIRHILVMLAIVAAPGILHVVCVVAGWTYWQPSGAFCLMSFAMLPAYGYWFVMRRPLFRCKDCGAKVLARDARS